MMTATTTIVVAVTSTVLVLLLLLRWENADSWKLLYIYPPDPCQRARVRDQRNSNPYVIHECDSAGNYEAKQKTVGTPHWYWCYTPDGDVIVGPSRKIETCACPSESHRVREANRANRKSDPEPACDQAGRFRPQQSDASHKWCVNKDTGAVTKQRVPQSQSLTC